jgi:hypothetical protein
MKCSRHPSLPQPLHLLSSESDESSGCHKLGLLIALGIPRPSASKFRAVLLELNVVVTKIFKAFRLRLSSNRDGSVLLFQLYVLFTQEMKPSGKRLNTSYRTL